MSLVDVVKDISGQTKSKVIFFLQFQIFCLSIDASVFHLNICGGYYLVRFSHFGKSLAEMKYLASMHRLYIKQDNSYVILLFSY